MKIKIEIKHYLTGAVLFEYESTNNTIKKTLVKAVAGGANLWGANLWRANLWRADLREANLWGANLWGANLWRADLREANLWRADLREANLWRADLRGADLRGADLRGADLREAKGVRLYWHIHHQQLVENLTEPLKNRIAYIKSDKPKEEQAIRLKLLKKVKCPINELPHTEKGWERLHKKECKKCPWKNGTIFPDSR
jgi:hypothetical protein